MNSHNNNVSLYYLVDTGASACILSHDIYAKHLSHIPLRKNALKIKGFSGGELVSSGSITLSFILGDSQFCFDFLVVLQAGYQALLGADFLKCFQANVNIACNTYHFSWHTMHTSTAQQTHAHNG